MKRGMMKRGLMVVVGVIGTVMLMAALHHVVVVVSRGGSGLAEIAGATCRYCHGAAYQDPGKPAAD